MPIVMNSWSMPHSPPTRTHAELVRVRVAHVRHDPQTRMQFDSGGSWTWKFGFKIFTIFCSVWPSTLDLLACFTNRMNVCGFRAGTIVSAGLREAINIASRSSSSYLQKQLQLFCLFSIFLYYKNSGGQFWFEFLVISRSFFTFGQRISVWAETYLIVLSWMLVIYRGSFYR